MHESPFDLGDIVRHSVYGRGEVMMISGTFVKVLFYAGTDRQEMIKVHESTLEKE